MISASNLTVYLGGKRILDSVSFLVNDGQRAAVVGPNGAGKSSLLKVLMGMVSAESGEVATPKGTTFGYLPQIADLQSQRTIREEMRSVFAAALNAFDEMRELEHRMGEAPHASDEYRQVARRYDFLTSEVHRLDAYALDANIGKVSAGLGFSASDLDRSCGEFSGGWQMRVELAKVLLSRPDVLLLDEPTNHLDLETIQWLEDWIMSQPAAVIFVSHERSFMDRLADCVFEMDRSRLTVYRGNYSDYMEERDDRRLIQQRAFENQQREIEKAELFIGRFRAQANKAAGVQSRIKMLEKMERLTLPVSDQGTIHFDFPQPPRSGKEVVTLKGAGHRYGDNVVFKGVDRVIYRGQRVALVGVNGAGKSTLMKIMAGLLAPTVGKVEMGQKVELQYFAQYEQDTLHPSWTVQKALEAVAPLGEAQRARDVAGAFLFSGDDVEKPVTVLSGGERTRLRLATMLFSPANLLLLDEPTNHLDVGSRQTLENALRRYTGTVVMVSHDRTFMDRVATRILEVHNGRVDEFAGSYRDYIKRHRAEMGLAARDFPEGHHFHKAPGASGGAVDGDEDTGASTSGLQIAEPTAEQQRLIEAMNAVPRKLTRQQREARKREDAETRRDQSKRLKPLRDRVRSLEKNIEQIEKRQAEIETLLSDPTTYANPQRAADLGKEQKSLAAHLAHIMADWEKASEELEAISS